MCCLLLPVFLTILSTQALAVQFGGLDLFQPKATNDGKGNVEVSAGGLYASTGLGDIFNSQGFHAGAGWSLHPQNTAGFGAGTPTGQIGGFNLDSLKNLNIPQIGGVPSQAGGFNLGSLLKGLNSFKLPEVISDPRAGLRLYKNTGATLGGGTQAGLPFGGPGLGNIGTDYYQPTAAVGQGTVSSRTKRCVSSNQNYGYDSYNVDPWRRPTVANIRQIPSNSFSSNGGSTLGQGRFDVRSGQHWGKK